MAQVQEQLVYVVDDDQGMLDSTVWLLESVGLTAVPFTSGRAFLDACDATRPACVLLDVRMPDMGGFNVQEEIRARRLDLTVIFVSGHADVPLVVRVLRVCACDFLEKPFKDQALIDAVGRAVKLGCEARARTARCGEARALLDRLSPRELEVARLVALGLPNKLVGRELDISEKTVHVHRHHVMEKTGVGSAAELARLMLRADPAALD